MPLGEWKCKLHKGAGFKGNPNQNPTVPVLVL